MIIDSVQQQLQCCGYDGKTDWVHNKHLMMPRGVDLNNDEVSEDDRDLLPGSCCPPSVARCSLEQGFDTPCRAAIKENFLKPNNVIGIMGIFIIIVVSLMCLTFLISFSMCCIARR